MVFTIAVIVFALSFVVAGRIQDKFGPLVCSLTGGILVSLGFYLCSYTTSLTYLYVCFGVIGGLGNGFGYATPIPVMAKWFPDKRGLAVGLAVGGYGAGSAIFGPLSQLKLIPAYGLPATFQILGASFLVMTMVGHCSCGIHRLAIDLRAGRRQQPRARHWRRNSLPEKCCEPQPST
jgi:MFS family permease